MSSPANKLVTKTITVQNTFSDPLPIKNGESAAISIVDTGVAAGGASTFTGTTVFVQRRFKSDQAADWRDVASYTIASELGFFAEANMEIRVGVKTGGLGGGDSITVDLRTG